MTEKYIICKNCIMVDGFLGIEINKDQLCNFCADPDHINPNWSKKIITKAQKKEGLKNWNKTVREMQRTHDGKHYDCIIGYSGGKDSTALVDTFVNEYHLNPLLITVDIGFMTDVAKENMKETLTKMDLFENHLIIEEAMPTFTKLYHHFFFSHDSREKSLTIDICHKCTDLIHTISYKEALNRNIPYVIIGFSPDQIARYFYETSKEDIITDGTPIPAFQSFIEKEEQQWYLTPEEIEKMNDFTPRVLYPYHVIEYDEHEIINRLESKGLIQKGKGDPVLTNCHVVKAALFYDFYRYGGITYALQYAELVRQEEDPERHHKSRKSWLRTYKQIGKSILNDTFNVEGMEAFFGQLGITKEELLRKIKEKRHTDPNEAKILQNIEHIRTNKLR
ncbi:MAG: hypothetical protein ACTSV5_02180 [Promethearchaeota archaeon]